VQARADPSTSELDKPSDDYTAYKDGKSIQVKIIVFLQVENQSISMRIEWKYLQSGVCNAHFFVMRILLLPCGQTGLRQAEMFASP